MRRFGWLITALVVVSAGCSKKQDTQGAAAQSQAQTQAATRPAAEPSVDQKIPEGPLDGNWYMKAGDQMRYGTHEALMNCMEKEKGIHVFLSGTVEAINQQIVRYYKSHPREIMLDAALKEMGHNPAAEAKLQEKHQEAEG